MQSFASLDPKEFRDSILIIDVDGTLTNDRHTILDEHALLKLKELSTVAEIYLCSNAPDTRVRTFAEVAGVSFLDTVHRKPSRRVLEAVKSQGKLIYVIGDKSLTDGFFALNIGARFIEVKRLRGENERPVTRLVYLVDDIAGFFMRPLFFALPYLILMRPVQWIKNLFVFAPIFFAGSFLSGSTLSAATVMFLVFCAASSAMYVLNDILDREQDRLHPTKRGRPVASGSVSVSRAWLFFVALTIVTVGGLTFVSAAAPAVGAYIILNVLYSAYLKHIPIIDLASVSSSYVIRVVAGGLATSTYVSPWIILCVFFGAFFIIVGKRRAEFVRSVRRRVLDSYSQQVLDALLISGAVLAVAAYGLYSVLGAHSPYAVFSSIFVAIAIFRMLSLVMTTPHAEYPESLIFKDRILLFSCLAWVAFMFITFYMFS